MGCKAVEMADAEVMSDAEAMADAEAMSDTEAMADAKTMADAETMDCIWGKRTEALRHQAGRNPVQAIVTGGQRRNLCKRQANDRIRKGEKEYV